MKKVIASLMFAFFVGITVPAFAAGYEPDYEETAPSKSSKKSKRKSSSAKKSSSTPTKTRGSDKSESKSGPDWLNGTWQFQGVISSPFGSSRVNATLFINVKTRQLVAVTDGQTYSKGTYYVEDNTIYAPSSTYFNLDMNNQRIDFGNGNYFKKTSNTSYLGN